MLRLNCLVATCVLALTVGAANAGTFDVTGSSGLPLGGTITIDTSAGMVTSEDVTIPNPPNPTSSAFTDLTSSMSSGGGTDWNITVNTPTSPEIYYLLMVLPTSSLVGYGGGSIITAVLYDNVTGFEEPIASCGEAAPAACGSLTLASTTPPSTPLPATLPLFAGGLGALGLLGWRRKRKARMVA